MLYHEFSWSYDLVAWIVSLGMWKRWVLLTLPFLEGPNVLELGHGPGHLQEALYRKGVNAFGLDESRWMGFLAYRRIWRCKFVPLLVNGYAQFLPFPPAFFQQVAATFPSEYIVDPSTLSEVRRVLSPGGLFVILPLAWITGQQPHYRFAAWLFRTTKQTQEWNKLMIEPFEEAGFQVQTRFLIERNSRVAIIIAKKV